MSKRMVCPVPDLAYRQGGGLRALSRSKQSREPSTYPLLRDSQVRLAHWLIPGRLCRITSFLLVVWRRLSPLVWYGRFSDDRIVLDDRTHNITPTIVSFDTFGVNPTFYLPHDPYSWAFPPSIPAMPLSSPVFSRHQFGRSSSTLLPIGEIAAGIQAAAAREFR